MGLHGDVFPSWDSNLSFLVLMGVFLIHQAVQVKAISCTPLSPGWAPIVNLVLWHHCWIMHMHYAYLHTHLYPLSLSPPPCIGGRLSWVRAGDIPDGPGVG